MGEKFAKITASNGRDQTTEPVENLLTLHRVAQDAAPAAVAAWLEQAIEAHLRDGVPMDEALGLQGGAGIRKARTKYLEAIRNHHLRAAWGLLDAPGPWRRSVALAKEVRRFASILWPRWRDLDAPPEAVSELRRQLFAAFRAAPVPESESRLHDICTPANPAY